MSDSSEPSDVDLVDEDDFPDANAVPAPTARAVCEYLVKAMVASSDDVEVEVVEGGRRGGVTLNVHVAQDDMGRVIGKRGRVAQAIRTVVRAAAVRDDVAVDVEFVE